MVEGLPAWSEPFTGDLSNLRRISRLDTVDRAWAFHGSTGRGVTVAIIDSGLEVGHPALRGRVVESVAVELRDGEPRVVADDGADLYGHGTACGGIVLGLAPDVELVSIRVLGADLRGKGAAFLAALDWAIERGVQVANLSLSSKSETLFGAFHEVADEAAFKGRRPGLGGQQRACAQLPLAVQLGVQRGPRRAGPMALVPQPAPPVEFGAWGVDVPIAWKDGGSTVATGNSFAAPHITGLVALIAAKHPRLTPFELKAVLAATANLPDEEPAAPSSS
ncbi:MAG: S8 family serine peptidase [Chloroflexota bacterium]